MSGKGQLQLGDRRVLAGRGQVMGAEWVPVLADIPLFAGLSRLHLRELRGWHERSATSLRLQSSAKAQGETPSI
jgi:hypothetical protein